MNLKELFAPDSWNFKDMHFPYISHRIPGFRKLETECLPKLRKLPSKLPGTVSSYTPFWIYKHLRSKMEWLQDFTNSKWPWKTINQLKTENSQLKAENQFLETRFYRVDLTLDPKTVHPRLEVSEDGKSVKDTGNIHDVSKSKERFESHTFVLAKQLFSEGRYYWEVEVGQKIMWDLGVASESAPRTGKITLSPQNGYWVIGRDDGKDYWARTDPWTCLNMPRKPTRIGIFLNTKSHEISFYDAQRKLKLYTFLNVASGKFYPFFSTGSVIGKEFDNRTLIIPPWFEEEEVVEEKEINN
ncbi:butyrophilin subfamily 3 member A1-like [Python bivittatus]|uniref:Butyrophilin subfamily 3 member A1-like n=1 Tax=Python bivittatus TaxID=176946 RepID=A0A9F3QUA3_PYTBI|nr:butyrophilin subfamily 3 member A1-like [Python bivittatus]